MEQSEWPIDFYYLKTKPKFIELKKDPVTRMKMVKVIVYYGRVVEVVTNIVFVLFCCRFGLAVFVLYNTRVGGT